MDGYPEEQGFWTSWVLWMIGPATSCLAGSVRLWSEPLQALVFSFLFALLVAYSVSLNSNSALVG